MQRRSGDGWRGDNKSGDIYREDDGKHREDDLGGDSCEEDGCRVDNQN